MKKTRKNKKFVDVDIFNAHKSYKHDGKFMQEVIDSNKNYITTYDYYKGTGNYDINNYLKNGYATLKYNGKTIPIPTKEDIPTDNKEILATFNKAIKDLEKEPTDFIKGAYCNLLTILAHIDNLFMMINKFDKNRIKKLPILYRGISEIRYSPHQEDPFISKNIGEKVSIPYFQSCSKSHETALGFQGCSQYGPCCLLVLNVHPDVKYIPVYWLEYGKHIFESYKMSEHEILLEPFVEYKLTKTYMKEFNLKTATICSYPKFIKDKSIYIKIYEIDVLPPNKDTIKKFNDKKDKLYKGINEMKKLMSGVNKLEIKL